MDLEFQALSNGTSFITLFVLYLELLLFEKCTISKMIETVGITKAYLKIDQSESLVGCR